MYVIQTEKNKFFTGGSGRTSDKDQAAQFIDKTSAEKYSKDIDGSKVIEKRKK